MPKQFPTLYVDMDGVLCDFITGMHHLFKDKLKISYAELLEKPLVRKQCIFDLISAKQEEEFFANLPVEPNADKLLLPWLNNFSMLENKWCILSCPFYGEGEHGSIRGKKHWLETHNLTSIPAIFEEHKEKYALNKKKQPNVLIDDHSKNIDAWITAGGIGILHHNSTADQTIRKLNEIYFF